MKPISAFRYFLLTHFGKPAHDREVYKAIRKFKIQSIVELGLGDGTRAETMIQIAKKYGVAEAVRYTGIDLFEARDDGQAKLTLKQMHKRANALGIKVQLVPGAPDTGVARIANSHLRTDLILVSGNQDSAELESCWNFFPRMLHAQSLVMIQSSTDSPFEVFNRLEVEKRASNSKVKVKAAA